MLQNDTARPKPFYNQLAILSILLALILVTALPFTGREYWNYNTILRAQMLDPTSDFEDQIGLVTALIIAFWKPIILASIGISMLPVMFGIFIYYRGLDNPFISLTILFLGEITAAACAIIIKSGLMHIVDQPFLLAGG
ncbi:hypothetical protein ACFL54_00710 [Planctomycetota bacterium]